MTSIGKYQVQGELGRGGFGTVYRAWDPVVNRSVAIKVLTVQGDDDLLTRFRNEAAAAGNLHHRNIVTIHDFGEHSGVPYMVMQLLEGNTLQEAVTRKIPYSLIQKMNIMGQVAEGLHHAHLNGIVHRDVKPPNIMILPDECVQIMDFGIARLTASTSRQTRTGFVIGTVLYMAPEQFLPNKVVDHRADIWAYGTIYYEFLTGRHPFAAAEETSVLYQIAHIDPPHLRSVTPECPQALEDVITRLLQKDPDLRYQNLKEVQFDVQPILVELKREHAQELVAEVRQLTGDGRFEEALAAAQTILELDPSNREAQTLLQQVRHRLQRRLIQPRITAMLQKAEQDVQSREFQSAIESLESALRLTGTDPAIESRLSQIRNLLEQSRRAERLVNDAQREMRAQNFTAAFRIASEAAHADPGNTSASHLISQIQHELDLRERQRQLEQGINRARGLLLLQQFEESIVALDELASEFPDDETVADLLASARREKQQQERLERRRKEISQVRDTLRQHRFESGITTLEMLLAEFPGDPEIKQLLSFARDEWQGYMRSQAISRARAEADRLCSEAEFDEALNVVEDLLSEYPGDASLVRLVQSVTIARSEYGERQRSMAIRTLLQQASEAERKGDTAGALRMLEEGLLDYADAEALASAAGRLRPIVAQQERREAIARHSVVIEAAIGSGEYARALGLIANCRREFPGERVFEAFANRANAARNAAELEMARARVRQEFAAGRKELALELVGVALKRFPNDVPLTSMDREIRAAIAAVEQQARIEREAAERRAAEEAERKAREEAERVAALRRAEAERKAREEAERKAREEAERKAREEAERKAREEAERKAREEAERKAREEAERKAHEEAERKAREEAERKAREEAERKAREEAERKAREEAEREAREEAERKAREEVARIAAEQRAQFEAERKAREEAERRAAEERKAWEAAERRAAEQRAHLEAERKAREEAERLAAEERAERERERKVREELELRSREEAARIVAEQQAHVEVERKARQEAERLTIQERTEREKERKAWDELELRSREAAVRIAAEQQAHFEAERKAREEAERLAGEERTGRERERKVREELELKSREEAARIAAEQRAQFEAERKAREEAERRAAEERTAWQQAERKSREEAERIAAEQRAQFEAERKAREEAERLAAAERAERERERKAREALDRKAREEAIALAAAGKAQAEAERKARQEAERLAAEERKAREAAERKAREESSRQAAAEKARFEAERKAREEAERRAAEERAQFERERKAREDADRKAREETERRAAEQRAQLERERKAREEAEKRAAEARAHSEKERKAWEDAEKKARRKNDAAAVATAGGAAAAPAMAPEHRRNAQLPLYLLGALVAGLLLVGGIYIFQPAKPAPAPVAQQQPQPPAESSVKPEPPVTEPAAEARPTGNPAVAPPPVVTAKAKPEAAKPAAAKPEPAKQQPVQSAARPPSQPENNAVPPPPVQTQPARAADSGSTRVVGDTGGRVNVAVSQAPPSTPSNEPDGPWRGRMTGKLAWSGQLPAGGRVVLNTQHIIEGGGELSIDPLPGFTKIEITDVQPKGKLAVDAKGPNSLTLANIGGDALTFIEVRWRVKQ